MHPALDNKNRLLSKTGTFWGEGMAEASKSVARRLVHMPASPGLDVALDGCLAWASGEPSIWVTGEERSFKEEDIASTYNISQERIALMADGVRLTFVSGSPPVVPNAAFPLFTENTDAYEVLAAETGQYLLWPVHGETLYVPSNYRQDWFLPWEETLDPMVLGNAAGDLFVAGVDFTRSGNVLVFFQHPLKAFPGRRIHVVSALRDQRALHSFTMKLDGVYGPTDYVAAWLRDRQSPLSFKLALAQVSGRVICPADTIIQATAPYAEGQLYICDGFELRVPYAHTALAAGASLEKDTVIGGGVEVFKGPAASGWWRAMDWPTGLSLDTLCPIQGLTVPDKQIRLEAVSSTVPGKLHTRAALEADAAALALYWQWTASAEIATGVWLADALSFANAGDTLNVNGLDFFFEYVLGARAMVVRLAADLDPTALIRARLFLKQEKPLGVVILREDG